MALRIHQMEPGEVDDRDGLSDNDFLEPGHDDLFDDEDDYDPFDDLFDDDIDDDWLDDDD